MREGVTDRYISRQVAVGFMAPKLVEAIVADEQRFSSFCVEDLRENQLPLSWKCQSDTTIGKADWEGTGVR
jgi:hypothetical protein